MPSKIGKYEVGELIGKGTCGKVYKSFDPFIQREVAIKVADKDKNKGDDFFDEAYAVGKLHHKHIVSLYDAGEVEGMQYLVMELIDGDTLYEYGSYKDKVLTDQRIVDIIYKCCLALDYSHKNGVVHRDMKPTNIMLSKSGEVKIMDYSIALTSEDFYATQKGLAVGTPNYMSPEQVRNKAIGPNSDLYSLAVVMYELLSKKLLFQCADVQKLFKKIINDKAPRLSELRHDLPIELDSFLAKALEKDQFKRFKSGKEMAIALSKIYERLRLSGKNIARSESRNSLSNLNFFNGFNDSEIAEIMQVSRIVTFKKGDVIIPENDVDDSFFIIIKGVVDVNKGAVNVETLSVGDCFGEIGFLLKRKRTATISASENTIVLHVKPEFMDNMTVETQLRYYKAFSETIIYRLLVTTARLAAAKSQS